MYLLNCSCCVAEVNAKRKQKELEESVAQSGHEYPSHHLCGDPLYDEISANNKQVFATQQCPAYAPLPPPRVWENNHHLPVTQFLATASVWLVCLLSSVLWTCNYVQINSACQQLIHTSIHSTNVNTMRNTGLLIHYVHTWHQPTDDQYTNTYTQKPTLLIQRQ